MNDGGPQKVNALLTEQDPPPTWMANRDGASDFVVICDHAGRSIPRRLGTLGVAESDLDRHIACDIGVEMLGRLLASALDAVCIGQRYSRLVIDCNRKPGELDSIVTSSDGTVVPGNQNLSSHDIAAREREIFDPYHAAIQNELDRRRDRGQKSCLILLHSFTPVWDGEPRPWEIGVLYNHDRRLAQALLRELRIDAKNHPEMIVGDNQPYTSEDGTDYALARYGEALGLAHVELEIRQDLLADRAGCEHWAQRLAELLPRAHRSIETLA